MAETHTAGDVRRLVDDLVRRVGAVGRAVLLSRDGLVVTGSSGMEREDAEQMAGALSWGTLHRLWQMLLKGLQDVQIAPDPREAAEMAILRLMLAADLPDPAALVTTLSVDGRSDSGKLAKDLVDTANVGLAPGTAFGPGGETGLRLCFARNSADLTEAVTRLQKAIAGL